MVRGAGKKEENAETEKRQWLKRLAIRNSLLSDRPAASGLHALEPSKLVMKHHGKDIMRKSQRSGKNRYLFSFPGLLAPISGGKIGELKDLGTKNPILYLDFPQGQMKLFGTIVYPKNRYLTLQFSRSGKNVMCEDYFDNMIVFSDAWWIGRKDENPEEARLQFPVELNVEKMEYDFKGGAGATCDMKLVATKPIAKLGEVRSPNCKLEEDSSDSKSNSKVFTELTPTRHSTRMAGKTFKFAETSSGDDFLENGIETSDEEEKKVEAEDDLESHGFKKTSRPKCIIFDIDEADAQIDSPVPEKEQPAKSASKNEEHPQSNKGPLVQATISTLFKKAKEKQGIQTDMKEKDNAKKSESRKKGKIIKEKKTGMETKVPKKNLKVQLNAKRKQNKVGNEDDDDDVQEFTSTSQESIESSDDDWVA